MSLSILSQNYFFTRNFLPTAAVILTSTSASALAAKTLEKSFIYETQGMSCAERISSVQNNFQVCPEARAAWNRINEVGAVRFECVAATVAPRGAAAGANTRTILVAEPGKTNEPHKRIPGQKSPTSKMLFELLNLERSREILDLFVKAEYGLLTLAQFQYEVEAFEFETAMTHHRIAKQCQKSGWDPDIAKQYDFGKDSPVQFTEEERRHWFATSPIAQYIQPTDSDAKIKYIMLNDLIGHTKLAAQRLQTYLNAIEHDEL